MYVSVLVRFHGADREMLLGVAKQIQGFVEKAGAERFNVVQIHTGPHSGDVLAAVRFPDWEVFGKATQSLYSDPEFLAAMAKLAPYFVERTMLTGLV